MEHETGIFANERVKTLLARMSSVADACFSDLDAHARTSARGNYADHVSRFNAGLRTVRTWNDAVQKQEANRALALFPDLGVAYKYGVTVYLQEFFKDGPPRVLTFDIPQIRTFIHAFLTRLAGLPLLTSRRYFGANYVEKQAAHADAIRFALYDVLVDQLVDPAEAHDVTSATTVISVRDDEPASVRQSETPLVSAFELALQQQTNKSAHEFKVPAPRTATRVPTPANSTRVPTPANSARVPTPQSVRVFSVHSANYNDQPASASVQRKTPSTARTCTMRAVTTPSTAQRARTPTPRSASNAVPSNAVPSTPFNFMPVNPGSNFERDPGEVRKIVMPPSVKSARSTSD